MKPYKQFIAEAKQVGSLYHYSDPKSIHSILTSNRLEDKNDSHDGYVSTTRNKNFHKSSRQNISSGASIELDGDKLSQKHKISPHHDQDVDKKWNPKTRKIEQHYNKRGENDESEERIKGSVDNIRNHVKSIRIHDKNIHPDDHERLKNAAKYLNVPLKYE